jgi:hypothetical protein
MQPRPDEEDDAQPDRRRVALVGLVVMLLIAALAVVLVRELARQSGLQDCVMSGRTNCAPIQVPARR